MPVEECYCCSRGDSIYRIDESSFYGYTTKSASDSYLIRVPPELAPWGWNELYVDPSSYWHSGVEVWWDNWYADNWDSWPSSCKPIGLLNEYGNPEAKAGTTHLYRRKFTLFSPIPGMQVTKAILDMWSDNKTEWWWAGTPISYNHEGFIGQLSLFPDLVRPDGGVYTLAIQNSNDRVSRDNNPQGTACRLCVTWAFPRPPSRLYLPLILK
jgi:hypothetical protein